MHSVGDREGLLLECSVGYLELRRLKLKHTWQLTACYNHQWQVAHGQYKFPSQRWLLSERVARQDGKGHA